jgi:hypothetical protein
MTSRTHTITTNELTITDTLYIDTPPSETGTINVPSQGYTSVFGTRIQGVYKWSQDQTLYGVNISSVRNGLTYYYNDITALQIKIQKYDSKSKIKITGTINYELDSTDPQDLILVIRRINPDLSEVEVGTPTSPDATRGIGLMSAHYQDNDPATTCLFYRFDLMDETATQLGEYTYIPRVFMLNNTRTFYLNRTVTNTPGVFEERLTSVMLLEEYAGRYTGVDATNFYASQTYTLPNNVQSMDVYLYGGGGGGGGGGTSNVNQPYDCNNYGYFGIGGGGGGSGYETTLLSQNVSTLTGVQRNITITVGAGGAGGGFGADGSAGSAGGTGGTTSVSWNSGANTGSAAGGGGGGGGGAGTANGGYNGGGGAGGTGTYGGGGAGGLRPGGTGVLINGNTGGAGPETGGAGGLGSIGGTHRYDTVRRGYGTMYMCATCQQDAAGIGTGGGGGGGARSGYYGGWGNNDLQYQYPFPQSSGHKGAGGGGGRGGANNAGDCSAQNPGFLATSGGAGAPGSVFIKMYY